MLSNQHADECSTAGQRRGRRAECRIEVDVERVHQAFALEDQVEAIYIFFLRYLEYSAADYKDPLFLSLHPLNDFVGALG